MPDVTRDWMAAAACSEGPRRQVTFTDLPEHHQSEIVRLAIVAAATTAYFVGAITLGPPLSSRSLTASAALPRPAQPRRVAIDARTIDAPLVPAPTKKRIARPRTAVEVVALTDPRPDPAAAPAAPPRRSVFSRFFHGLLRTIGPADNTRLHRAVGASNAAG